MRNDDDLSKLVNQSGFPLQLAIDRLVHDRADQLGWKVVYREHGWRHPDGQSGLADLVLGDCHGTSVLVVECKRVLEADWLFLEELPAKPPSRRTRLWATNTADHGKEFSGYYDARATPESSESMYCVVAGQDAKSRPMLERVAAETTAAMEAIAIEELPVITKRQYGLRMYVPVIVTTARLVVSRFDPKLVVLKNGEASTVSHETHPWIRFRKQFSPEFATQPKDPEWDFSALATAKEKLVYVVNVESFAEFLAKWDVANNSLRALM
jgi:hypothetical protein